MLQTRIIRNTTGVFGCTDSSLGSCPRSGFHRRASVLFVFTLLLAMTLNYPLVVHAQDATPTANEEPATTFSTATTDGESSDPDTDEPAPPEEESPVVEESPADSESPSSETKTEIAETEEDVATPVSFEPTLDCQRPTDTEPPIAGETEPGWLDCLLVWSEPDVQSLHLVVRTGTVGWTVLLVTPAGLDEPLPDADITDELDLLPASTDDSGRTTARFLIGSRVSCTSILMTKLDLEISAGIPGVDIPLVASWELTESGILPPAPIVSLNSLWFSAISNSRGPERMSTGQLDLTISGAPARCGWSVSLIFSDFTDGTRVFSADHLVATGLSTALPLFYDSQGGTITFWLPPSADANSPFDTIQIDLSLTLASFTPQGRYSTTVTVASVRWGG